MKTTIINQSKLSSECWSIQAHGFEYCKTCEFKNTKDCGSKQIIKTGKNKLGIKIPIGINYDE